MNIHDIKKIYFLGIGGIGMSALAKYFMWKGIKVAGYDKTTNDITKCLENEGADIHYIDDPELIPSDIELVVFTPAIPVTDREFMFLKASGLPMLKRAEVLGLISQQANTIAIAGTHGKTTITTMVAHILKTAGVEILAFMGGISINYGSNFLASDSPQWIIVEADEYDRSFLQLNPQIAVITSMDADHLDIYSNRENFEESFKMFIGKIAPDGALVLNVKLSQLKGLHPNSYTYGFVPEADIIAENARIEYGMYVWEVDGKSGKDEFTLGVPGKYNMENALAATVAASLAEVDLKDARKALRTYRGVKRRFEIQLQSNKLVYIDDYAHHPDEIKAFIGSVREMFPERRITAIFQPHLFSRTRDFADEFAEALAMPDELILLEIYPARELPIAGINSQFLLNKVELSDKKLIHDTELLRYISKNDFDVLLTIGAGDIDRFVEPIKILLERC